MIKIAIGFFIGVFTSWTSFMIGMERQAHVELVKSRELESILNERDHYKKFYEEWFHKHNSGY